MIFVTVGTELPFDRLVRTIDDWARGTGRDDVFAQVGATHYEPSHIAHAKFLEAPAFQQRFATADLVISHAGMGTILTALSLGHRLLVMPRRASLGEHRNEHQLATARHLLEKQLVDVAFDEDQLRRKLEHLDRLEPKARIPEVASPQLIETLRGFISNARQPNRAAVGTQANARPTASTLGSASVRHLR